MCLLKTVLCSRSAGRGTPSAELGGRRLQKFPASVCLRHTSLLSETKMVEDKIKKKIQASSSYVHSRCWISLRSINWLILSG